MLNKIIISSHPLKMSWKKSVFRLLLKKPHTKRIDPPSDRLRDSPLTVGTFRKNSNHTKTKLRGIGRTSLRTSPLNWARAGTELSQLFWLRICKTATIITFRAEKKPQWKSVLSAKHPFFPASLWAQSKGPKYLCLIQSNQSRRIIKQKSQEIPLTDSSDKNSKPELKQLKITWFTKNQFSTGKNKS